MHGRVDGHACGRLGVGAAEVSVEERPPPCPGDGRAPPGLDRVPGELRPVGSDVVRRITHRAVLEVDERETGAVDQHVVAVEVAVNRPQSRRRDRLETDDELAPQRRDARPLGGEQPGELGRARDDRRDLGRRVTLVRERDRESVELGEAYAGPFAEGREVLGAGEQEEADAGHGPEERHAELGDDAQGLGQAEEEARRRGMQSR